jgi:hypothetical protein
LAKLMRRRYGVRAAARVQDLAGIPYLIAFTAVVSTLWGFFWWGAGFSLAALLIQVVGTWLYRRRSARLDGTGNEDQSERVDMTK